MTLPDAVPAAPPDLEDLREAAAGLAGATVPTRLLDAPFLSAVAGVPVAIKCEFEQPTGAFKVRGALTALRRMDPAVRARGVVAYSSGNHGQAVAWAARRFGVRAVIVMPETAARVKVEGVKALGGEVALAAPGAPARKAMALEIAAREGLAVIPPFDHPDVIAGQGTCGLEILEQRPDVAAIIVPVSGGGLMAGIAVAARALRPGAELIAVEPAGAAKLTAAWAAGHPVTIDHPTSLADGLLTSSVGALTFPLIRGSVRRVVTVGEEAIRDAVRRLHAELGIRVEPSGAVTTAAVLGGLALPGPTVCVATGGNLDDALFAALTG